MEFYSPELAALSLTSHFNTEVFNEINNNISSGNSSDNYNDDNALYFRESQQQLLKRFTNDENYLEYFNDNNSSSQQHKSNHSIATHLHLLTSLTSVTTTTTTASVPSFKFSRQTEYASNDAHEDNDILIINNNTLADYFQCDGEAQSLSALNATLYNRTDHSSDAALSSVYFKVTVYLLYIPIFIFALLGNGTVCYIVQSTPRMRTVTNFFIANLAVGDILMSLFCIPSSFISIFILGYWPFGIALCYLVNYSQAVSVLVSAYTLVAISIDRYIAIMWPLKPRITKRYAKIIIAFIWFVALATAFPIPLVSKLVQPGLWHEYCERYVCQEAWPNAEQEYYYTLALLTLQFIVPLSVLVFTYTRIALAVWGKRPPGEAENSRDQRMARSKRKMIKMMVTVVIVFTMCWLPFNILILLLNDEEFRLWGPLPYIWFAFHWLAMSHSCYNPIIYCYMNARFRGGFLQIIHRVPGLRRCCCLRHFFHSRDDRSYEATGEMTFKFKHHIVGGLIRKPKIRIRNRRCIPAATCQHLHNLHQQQAKIANELDANEMYFNFSFRVNLYLRKQRFYDKA
ncbi:RYamide receptor isoform 2-T8 [Glossina fuscipes fuscipes]